MFHPKECNIIVSRDFCFFGALDIKVIKAILLLYLVCGLVYLIVFLNHSNKVSLALAFAGFASGFIRPSSLSYKSKEITTPATLSLKITKHEMISKPLRDIYCPNMAKTILAP
ncbi:hypothetical protein CQA63_02060 [Helicobacter marmotae]|uniref:Uncharacterized protein n=1 Tax=Helicobacter marmotae TaxID=152490 RepID=A0A3D8I6H8_9HELI|nr:hypothetical protein CQA63_02060 [Helicobacter marmotae]